jgi:hypothetical protein
MGGAAVGKKALRIGIGAMARPLCLAHACCAQAVQAISGQVKQHPVALALGKKADALKYFTEIKEKYESSPEGSAIDALIGLAQ